MIGVNNNSDKNALYSFAYCKDFDRILENLAELAAPEDWGTREGNPEQKNPILYKYIHHTFARIYEEFKSLDEENKHKKLAICGEYACFNTGLFTENYEPIYGLFQKHKYPGQQDWFLIGFFEEGNNSLKEFSHLPERASYFTDISELIFDYRLQIRPQMQHILGDPENIERLPKSLQEPSKRDLVATLLNGQIELVKRKVAANYKLAVPQFYKGSVQLLLPLCLEDGKTPDLALVIKKEGNYYSARTCLTLEMAYNNARLIAKPETDWLKSSFI